MELITFDYLFVIYLGIFFLGGLVKGTIGVGLPTVTLTLLSFFFDIKDSISFILIPVILTNLVQMLDGKELKSIFQQTKFFLFTSVVFVIPGFLVLRAINSNTILLILASLLVLNSCLVLFNKIITIKRHTSFQTQFWIGALTGITTGVTSIYTMPFIFLIQSLKFNKEKLIQLMGLSFFLYSLTQFALFYSFSMINESFSPTSMAAPSSRSFLYPLPSSPSFFQPCFMNNSPIASRVPDVGGGTMIETGIFGKPARSPPIRLAV